MLHALILLAAANASGTQSADNAGQEANFSFSESRRKESRHRATFNGSEGETVSGGNWTIRCDFPITPKTLSEFGPDTPVVIEAGTFKLSQELKDDPHFSVGKQSADLVITSTNSSGKSKTIMGTVHMRWSGTRATISFSGGWGVIVGDDYTTGYGSGPVEGITKAHAAFGSYSRDFDVSYKGKVKKITVGDEDNNGEVVTVDLKGQGKA